MHPGRCRHLAVAPRSKVLRWGRGLATNSTACQRPRGDPFVWTRPRHMHADCLASRSRSHWGRSSLCPHPTSHTAIPSQCSPDPAGRFLNHESSCQPFWGPPRLPQRNAWDRSMRLAPRWLPGHWDENAANQGSEDLPGTRCRLSLGLHAINSDNQSIQSDVLEFS